MKKKHILVISQVYPYPLHDGGRVDIFYRLKALHNLGYKISLIPFYNPNLPDIDQRPLKEFCQSIYPIPYLRRQLSKVLAWRPYSIGSKENYALLEEVLKNLQDENFSSILAESLHVYPIAKYIQKTLEIDRVYLRSHNNEPRFMFSVAKASPLLSLRQLFFLQESMKYFVYEKFLFKSFDPEDVIWHISYDEHSQYQKLYPKINHLFVPAAIDLNQMQSLPNPSDVQNVLFVGALFSPNNLQGLKWYLKHVHPQLCLTNPRYQLVVAGTTKGANQKKISRLFSNVPRLHFYDTPEDLGSIYRESQVFINPMQHGAGVKLKTVQAALHGLPIVSTTTGNEGTGFKHNQHLLIADSPEHFTHSIKKYLNTPSLREKSANTAQQFIIQKYNQEKSLREIL